MKILSYNPGHDGTIAYLQDAHLVVSVGGREELELPIFSYIES